MAYTQYTWDMGDSIEHQYSFAGNYGAKGEKRQKKQKATPEQIKKQNQWKKVNNIRRIIKLNFRPEDLWVTLKYPKGERFSISGISKNKSEFLRRLRTEYKKRGCPLKWICRIEIGSLGGIHIHFLVNRIRADSDTDVLIGRIWKEITGGGVWHTSLYEKGGYQELAEYIAKRTPSGRKRKQVEGQLSLFPPEEQKKLLSYSTSRNLIRPVPVVKKYSHWTMRRILRDGIKPKPGFYIVKESIRQGVNRFTGMSYLYYTENRIKEVRDG